jgi:hypothetical protein
MVPYPAATDNHQFFNARAFVDLEAARLLEQSSASPEALLSSLRALMENGTERSSMQKALETLYAPRAAEAIAESILAEIFGTQLVPASREAGTRKSLNASETRQLCVTESAVAPLAK